MTIPADARDAVSELPDLTGVSLADLESVDVVAGTGDPDQDKQSQQDALG